MKARDQSRMIARTWNSAAQLLPLEIPFRLDLADDADVHSGLRPGHQDLQHRVVGELGVVDEELPPRRSE